MVDEAAAPAPAGEAGGDAWALHALRGAVQTVEFSCLSLEHSVSPEFANLAVGPHADELFALLRRLREAATHADDFVRHGADVARGAGASVPDFLSAAAPATKADEAASAAAGQEKSSFREALLKAAQARGDLVRATAAPGHHHGGAHDGRGAARAFQTRWGSVVKPHLAHIAKANPVGARAGKECELPNFKGSSLGRFRLVSADFWTSDHLSERSRSVGASSGTRARGTLTLKRRCISLFPPRSARPSTRRTRSRS